MRCKERDEARKPEFLSNDDVKKSKSSLLLIRAWTCWLMLGGGDVDRLARYLKSEEIVITISLTRANT